MLNKKFLVLGILTLLLSGEQAVAAKRPSSQVIVEAGVALPYGNLGADFEKVRLGLGASPGLELGFSYRIALSQTVVVAPSFLFTDFGDFSGVDDGVGEFRIQASTYHYGLAMMVKKPGGSTSLRPFLGLEAGLFRNRITGFVQDFVKEVDQSINTFGVSLRAGVEVVGLEFSVVYNVNRFNTWQFFQSDYRERYNWDNISFRAGWLIPFGK